MRGGGGREGDKGKQGKREKTVTIIWTITHQLGS